MMKESYDIDKYIHEIHKQNTKTYTFYDRRISHAL